MRTISIVAIAFATLSLVPTAAHAAPWCANYGGRGGGGTNCGFYSFAQCMAAVSGTGGFCSRNQFENPYRGGREPRRRYRDD